MVRIGLADGAQKRNSIIVQQKSREIGHEIFVCSNCTKVAKFTYCKLTCFTKINNLLIIYLYISDKIKLMLKINLRCFTVSKELFKMGKSKTINCLSLVISLMLIFTMFFNVYGCGNATCPEFFSASGVFQKGSNKYDKLPYVYSDSYFKNSATQYNSSLATMSLCLELSAFANKGSSGTDYKNQSQNVKKLLKDIGFKNIEVNIDFEKKPTLKTIGVATANKQIYIDGRKYTLIPIVVRGGGYEAEWANNMLIGSVGNHRGFDDAARVVKNFVDDYINNTEEIEKNIKFWIVGYSRGGAVAGLVGKLYNDYCNVYDCAEILDVYNKNINISQDDIYTYTFEAPMGYSDVISNKCGKYYNIHNIINDDDFVTKLALSEWGFVRPGIDHKLLEEILKVKDVLSKMCVNIHGKNKVEYKADKFQTYGCNWFSEDISTQSKFLNEFFKMISNNIFEKYSNDKCMSIKNSAKYKRLAYSEHEDIVARFVGLIQSDEIFIKALHNVLETFLDENSKSALVGKAVISNSKLKQIVRNVVESTFVEYNLKQSKIDSSKQVSREEIDDLEKGISDLLISVNKISNYRYLYIFIKNIDNIIAMHEPEICLATLINKDENNKIAYLDQMKHISDNFVLNGSSKAA